MAEDNDEIAALPIILGPVIVEGIKLIAITAASLGTIKAANNIQEILAEGDIDVFRSPFPEPTGETGDNNTGSTLDEVGSGTEPFDLGAATEIDPKTLPQGNEFLEDILNGQFEFPDAEEGGSYFLAAGAPGNELGNLREQAVAESLGVELVKESNGRDISVFEEGASESVEIDVFGPNGELILVGGPAKAKNLGKLGGTIKNLKTIADVRGVKAQYYFSDNTSEKVIEFAEKRLGAENVFTFPEVNAP